MCIRDRAKRHFLNAVHRTRVPLTHRCELGRNSRAKNYAEHLAEAHTTCSWFFSCCSWRYHWCGCSSHRSRLIRSLRRIHRRSCLKQSHSKPMSTCSPYRILEHTFATALLWQRCRQLRVSYTHLRAHETVLDLVCRLLLEK